MSTQTIGPNPNIPTYNFQPPPPEVDPYNPAASPANLNVQISPSDQYALQFSSDFWMSMNGAVQALWSMPAVTSTASPRYIAFQALVAAGNCKNDAPLLAYGEDPYTIIHQRQVYKAMGVSFDGLD